MHKHTKRLYEAAESLRSVRGQSALARTLGVSPQTIYNWEKRGISSRGLLAIESRLGISATWLEAGRGSMSAANQGVVPAPLGLRRVFFASWDALPMDSKTQETGAQFLTTDLDLSTKAFALEIIDNSMAPDFQIGDRIVIDPTVQPTPGDYVVAEPQGQAPVFRKYRSLTVGKSGKETFELIPVNTDFALIQSSNVSTKVVGVMLEHRRYRKR